MTTKREASKMVRQYLLDHLRSHSDKQLLVSIKLHQDIQRRNPPASEHWESASRSLELLFTEMRRRYPVGAGPAVLS